MTSQDQKPLLPILWNRIKRFFIDWPTEPKVSSAKLEKRVRFLEQCLLKTDAIEATRIQLEHHWEDVST